MKLFEIAQTTQPKHAFWQKTRGPNNMMGVSLHYLQNLEQHHDALRAQAQEKGDDRWLGNIERMANQYKETGQKYSWPSLDWWMSMDAYENGQTGFSGYTKDKVEQMGITIHDSAEEAKAHAEEMGD